MNLKTSLLCLSFCFAGVISMSIVDSAEELGKDFKEKFHKPYIPIRKAKFNQNLEKINLNNERLEKREVSFNSFADMDPVDDNKMQSKYGSERCRKISDMFNVTDSKLPENFNWAEKHLSSVPNMEGCDRGDWAFATVGMLEEYLYHMCDVIMSLSAQDLLDCSKEMGNSGCNGGYVKTAFEYIQQNGISDATSYPFKTSAEECKKDSPRLLEKGCTIKTKIMDYKNENLMRAHIFKVSPIIAQIPMSDWKKFDDYKGKIFTKCNATATDDDEDEEEEPYNVLIVGYGEENSTKYWIIKNWMGPDWGEKGYAKVERDMNCGGIFSNATVIESIELNH